MPYKISGTLDDSAKVIVVREDTWAIESNTDKTMGAYEIDSLVSGTKTIIAITSEGEVVGYGEVTPIEY